MKPDIPDEGEMNAAEMPVRRGIIPVGGPRLGPAHDRGLCALTALLAAVAVSRHLVSHGGDPLGAPAIGLYLGASMAGYGVGKAIPAEYRAVLQVAATTALTLVGAGTMGGF